tara:strand:- start:2319 stop:3476 length:1158 start_codon:yes stop_codon:yes gene_type:complete
MASVATPIAPDLLKKAVYSRGSFFLANRATLTMKQARRLLELDLGLDVKDLDETEAKLAVGKYVDKVLASGGDLEDSVKSKENQAPNKSPGVKAAKPFTVPKPAKPAVASDDDENEAEDDDDDDNLEDLEGSDSFSGDDSDSDRKTKKRKSDAKNNNTASKKKKTAAPKPAANPITGVVADLRDVCKLAGLTYQHVFMKHKAADGRIAALETILSEAGLNLRSSADQVNKCKAKVELAKDMEGIDTKNVIEGGRRRRAVTGTDAHGDPIDYAKLNGKKNADGDSDDDALSESDDDDDDSEDDVQSEDEDDTEPNTKPDTEHKPTGPVSDDDDAKDIFFEDEEDGEDAVVEAKETAKKVSEKVTSEAPALKPPRRGGALYSDSDED